MVNLKVLHTLGICFGINSLPKNNVAQRLDQQSHSELMILLSKNILPTPNIWMAVLNLLIVWQYALLCLSAY